MNTETNPCPQCGELPIFKLTFHRTHYVVYHDCTTEKPHFYIELKDQYETMEKAVEAWNAIIVKLINPV